MLNKVLCLCAVFCHEAAVCRAMPCHAVHVPQCIMSWCCVFRFVCGAAPRACEHCLEIQITTFYELTNTVAWQNHALTLEIYPKNRGAGATRQTFAVLLPRSARLFCAAVKAHGANAAACKWLLFLNCKNLNAKVLQLECDSPGVHPNPPSKFRHAIRNSVAFGTLSTSILFSKEQQSRAQ